MNAHGAQTRYGLIHHALRLLVVSVLSVSVIDLIVLLDMLRGSCSLSSNYYGTVQNFTGLLVADARVGLLIAAAVLLGAFILSRLPFLPDCRTESVILLSFCLVPLALLDHTVALASLVSKSRYVLAGALAAVFAVVFVILHLHGRKWKRDEVDLQFILNASLFPALIAGLIVNALSWFARLSVNGVFDLGLAIVFIACMVYGRRGAKGWRKTLANVCPIVLSIVLVGTVLVRTMDYGAGGSQPASKSGEALPSIALIVLDTVRADHLELYGYTRNTMPYLDKWAQSGVVFDRAISPGGWTTPSHASFFSGKTVSLHGVHYGLKTPVTEPVGGIEWLPDLLRARGYYTLAVSANVRAFPRADIGFDRILSPTMLRYARSIGKRAEDVLPFSRRWSERMRWRTVYADAENIVRITKRALPEGREAPVFLFLNFLDAHAPYNPPEKALDRLGVHVENTFPRYYGHDEITGEWPRLAPGKRESLCDLYDGELMWLDMHLEELLPWLEKALGPGNIIIIVSDHGEELGEDGSVGHGSTVSQRILHVPLIILGDDYAVGRNSDVIATRRLFDFILACADGNTPGPEFLGVNDEFATIAEMYPTYAAVAPHNPMRHCPRVVFIRDALKVVGPSVCETAVYDIEASGFRDCEPLAETATAAPLIEFVDTYWDVYRDRRDEGTAGRKLSEEEREKFRALGYIR